MSAWTKIKKKLKSGTWYPFYNTFYEKTRIDPYTILLESRSGRGMESNIFAILRELNQEEYRKYSIVFACRSDYKASVEKKLQHYGLKVDKLMKFGSISYYRMLSRAKYLINDSTFPGRFIKKDGQIYLNVWHGTPLKCMGRDNVEERYSMGNVMRNLLMSDYLLFSNVFMEEKMRGAYMLDNLYQGQFIHECYPRNEIFFHPDKGEALKKKFGFGNLQVSVYMPTFRGNADAVDSKDSVKEMQGYLDVLDRCLDEDQLLLVKLHPFVGNGLNLSGYQHIQKFPEGYDTYEVLNMCDVLITDYSSVMYDFANSGKKIILFAYDIEDYAGSRGMYEDIRTYPFPLVRTPKEVADLLKTPVKELDEAFRKKYGTYEHGSGIRNLCHHVILGENLCHTASASGNQKKNVLIYAGDFQQNGITTSFLNLMKELDQEKYNYFISYRMNSLKEAPWRLDCLPHQANVYPLGSEMNMDVITAICQGLYMKLGIRTKRLTHAYAREWKKHFGNSRFQAVLHFNGYENYIISMFEQAPFSRTIWVHNDMEKEIERKKNPNKYVLHDAYASYDHVAAVSRDLTKAVEAIGGRRDNITVIPNCQDYEGIKRRSGETICFDQETKCTVSLKKLQEVLNGSDQKFINIGRFSQEKQHSRLIQAFELFWKKNKNTWLIIIGGAGNLYEQTCQLAKNSAAGSHIILIRSIRNPMPILKASDLLILSSDYEGLPVVLFEAAVLGVPFVTTNVPGARCFCEDYGGMLTEPSVLGVLKGMEAFERGECKAPKIDCRENNRKSLELFETLLQNDFQTLL